MKARTANVSAIAGVLALLVTGCGRSSASADGRSSSAGDVTASSATGPQGDFADAPAKRLVAPPAASTPASTADAAPPQEAKGPAAALRLGPVVDLGPARLVAVGAGVVATIDASSDLRVTPLAAVTPAPTDEPKVEPLAPTAPVLLGPSPTYAYWVAAGQLRRRHVRDGQALGAPEPLTEDASAGLGIAAARTGGPRPRDVVAYVGVPQGDQGERPPRLWVEGQGPIALSRESGNASAVGLCALEERKLLALSLDGRLGMSLLHAVAVELDDEGRARVGEDRVVYVAGSAERNTRFETMRLGVRALVLLPIAHEPGGFGLASLLLPEGKSEAVPLWRSYPNGLDPAPVAGAEICGAPHVAYARPSEARADGGHVVELAAVGPDGALGPALPVGRAGRVVQVVLAAASAAGTDQSSRETGGWIAYAADTGLWAHPIRCGSGDGR